MNPTKTAKAIRRIIIETSFVAGVGHIGSCLSVADILAALYAPDGGVLRIADPYDADRDRFILSCGHKNLALFAALHLRGWISEAELATYCQDGSPLYSHPNHHVRGVEYSTGSLGMGLSFACGEALAAKMIGSKRKVYCLVSDAEIQEGAIWESVEFAVNEGLDNLIVIVDANEQQALGRTLSDRSGIVSKFDGFGWRTCSVRTVEPNIFATVLDACSDKSTTSRPIVVIAHTTFGSGVSFMENSLEWHYRPMNSEQYAQALTEVTR
jgi:transketolase